MSKRRVTLTLDEDLIEALEQLPARSLSAAANDSLRQAIDSVNHRRAALTWLTDLDERYGKATPDEVTEIEAWLDEIGFGSSSGGAAGAA